MARTAASFISSLILDERTSRAPRKMNGKPRTLLTWFGLSERPVAIMISSRALIASSYLISGSGFAKAKTIGFGAMLATIFLLTIPPFDNPTNTSAFFSSSSSCASGWSWAKMAFSSVRDSRHWVINPFESHMKRFFVCTPRERYNLAHDMADAPAPLKTTLTLVMSFSANSKAFNKAAAVIMAVPCWSSCIIGMSNSSLRRFSM